jgi:hypothetical protein
MQIRDDSKRLIALDAVSKAPDGAILTIKDPTRTLEQNAMFHALCTEASMSCLFMGKQIKAAQWKVLFISGHAIATGIGADIVPGLEGEFVNIRESSAQMGIKRMTSLIEYTQAYIANNDSK